MVRVWRKLKMTYLEVKDNLQVGDKKVEVLRDTGCSGVIIRRELVDEADFTGEMVHIMTVDRTLK